MNKYIKYLSAMLLAVMCCMPIIVSAEPDEYEPVVSMDSFVINSNEDEHITATIRAVSKAEQEIEYKYTISVVTDISQDGQQVSEGQGMTGQPIDVKIDMSRINSHSAYRFKIVLSYQVDGVEEFATAFSKTFEFTQETFADDLKDKKITVNITSGLITIDWSRYMSYGADGVLVSIDEDGKNVVEELVSSEDKKYYEHYYNEDTKKVTVTLKQVIDGELSKGITQDLNMEKGTDPEEFYLVFPEGTDRYNRIWNIQYKNGTDTSVSWKSSNMNKKETLNGDGTFLIELEEANEELYLEYTDAKGITWVYNFATDVATYAPDIDMLEAYNGCTVSASSIILAGRVSDTTASITINGAEVKVDANGMFQGEVSLETGKNVVTIEATSQKGKAARKSITIYKESGGFLDGAGSIFAEYMPLIITLSVSVVFIVVLLITSKRRKKNEKQA